MFATSMLVVRLVKYTEFGNLLMQIKAPRNPVLDYMAQASFISKDYLLAGWHLVYAYIE
jgi:hypothetical protein